MQKTNKLLQDFRRPGSYLAGSRCILGSKER
nr:MAG TPA: hypothetical protein [Caudoviricetes sp.]